MSQARHGRRWVVVASACVAVAVAGCGAAGTATQTGRPGAPAGARTGTRTASPPSGTRTSSSASCAVLTVAQQYASARIIFDGTMLPGPTVRGVGGALASPARVRVDHYVKGTGPSTVTVMTAVTRSGGAVSATEDGIEAKAGQRWQIFASGTAQPFATSLCAGTRLLPALAGTLPLPEGSAWYSNTLETAPDLGHPQRTAHPTEARKWLLWSGERYEANTGPTAKSLPGTYGESDNEPGFGDWDAVDVGTLPDTPLGVMALLRSGRLDTGQEDHSAASSPLVWLAELATMLADNPNTPAARAAAVKVIATLPGAHHLGPAHDARGRSGIGVSETSSDLHPLMIATGPGCQNPIDGGAGCNGAASPAGTYRTTLIYDPNTQRPLSLQTVALQPVPAARLATGTLMYRESFLTSHVDPHPQIPAPAPPANETVESVPWTLGHASGSSITVNWSSGTCDPELHPDARLDATETAHAITLRVLIHVVTDSLGGLCAGVGLEGRASTTLTAPIDGRPLRHGTVTYRGG